MKIAVAGLGYVGLSLAVLLAQRHDVYAVDILEDKVALLQAGKSPLADSTIEQFLEEGKTGVRHLSLHPTTDAERAYSGAEFVIIATPTNYDDQRNHFDTESVEAAIRTVRSYNSTAWIVIKSTVPVGYTNKLRKSFQDERLLFSPEFLREGHALDDNLRPSRIIVGIEQDPTSIRAAHTFAELLVSSAADGESGRLNRDGSIGVPVLFVGTTEAEAIKLFANTYLALRVAYFNELDTYAEMRGLNARDIIDGVCLDPRIGSGYNNPSFGYGGYCLPKDTKQLLANYDSVPQNLIAAIVEANRTRKDYIAEGICHRVATIRQPLVGIYRLTMKSGSDNFRQSAIQGIIERLRVRGCRLLIFEPTLSAESYFGVPVERDFGRFCEKVDIIVANRWESRLDAVADKVYTRDLFCRD